MYNCPPFNNSQLNACWGVCLGVPTDTDLGKILWEWDCGDTSLEVYLFSQPGVTLLLPQDIYIVVFGVPGSVGRLAEVFCFVLPANEECGSGFCFADESFRFGSLCRARRLKMWFRVLCLRINGF